MTNVQLLQLAQSAAAAAVNANASALATDQAMVAAFTGSGNPDTDYPNFKQVFNRELQNYRNAAQRDKNPAGSPGPVRPPGAKTIPLAVWQNLPPATQARIAAANPGAVPVEAATATAAPAAPAAAATAAPATAPAPAPAPAAAASAPAK